MTTGPALRQSSKQKLLTAAQREYLSSLGLSAHAVKIYNILLNHKSMTVQELASVTKAWPNAEYRLLYLLEINNLVRRIPGRPMKFAALALQAGLQASYVHHQDELRQLINPKDNSTPVKIMLGRQQLYDYYAKIAQHATAEICVFSIGIAFSPELHKVQRDAVKRGVRIRHVAQQYKPDNYHILQKWHRAGVKLRILEQERGYHLTIVDEQTIVTFSDPHDTEQRVSFITNSPATTRVFKAQFDLLWNSSRDWQK